MSLTKKYFMTKKLLLCVTIWMLLVGNLFAQMTCINGTVKVLASGYALNCVYALPKNFDATKSYPLVLFFHGSGEAGTNIATMYNQGLPNVLKSGYQPPFDFIMAAPQATSYGCNPDWIQYILADVKSKYKIDTTRIYATGLSAGGWATFGSQMNEPTSLGSTFAAIAPLSAATQDLTAANYTNFKSTQTYVWDIVGATDVSYVANNQALCNNINSVVPNLAQFYTRAGIGHGNWIDIYNTTYKDPTGQSIWQFLYSHTRGVSAPPTPVPIINSTLTTTGTMGTQLTYQITATNSPTSYSATGLPAGLSINTTLGNIGGIPTVTGTYNVNISATNSGGTGTSVLVMTINKPAPTITQTITIDVYSDGTTKIH